jgi:hypothetical protein
MIEIDGPIHQRMKQFKADRDGAALKTANQDEN